MPIHDVRKDGNKSFLCSKVGSLPKLKERKKETRVMVRRYSTFPNNWIVVAFLKDWVGNISRGRRKTKARKTCPVRTCTTTMLAKCTTLKEPLERMEGKEMGREGKGREGKEEEGMRAF